MRLYERHLRSRLRTTNSEENYEIKSLRIFVHDVHGSVASGAGRDPNFPGTGRRQREIVRLL
jgi:hypothetical protein